MKRLFIAIDVPDWASEELTRLCVGQPDVRWANADQHHLTLRFIGDVEGHQHERIERVLAGVMAESFTLNIQGVGHFPPRGAPRTLWAGVEACQPLVTLRSRVDRAMVALGTEPAHRKWHPHITLGRLAYGGGSRAGRFFQDNALFQLEPFLVTSFSLYSSQLGSNGALHTIERTYPLAG
jgi:2'-5' RNA ligase